MKSVIDLTVLAYPAPLDIGQFQFQICVMSNLMSESRVIFIQLFIR